MRRALGFILRLVGVAVFALFLSWDGCADWPRY